MGVDAASHKIFGEQAARRRLLLIGSALARSRGWHVREMFGIEDFCGKPNGNGTIGEFLHPNIAARLPRGNGAATAHLRRVRATAGRGEAGKGRPPLAIPAAMAHLAEYRLWPDDLASPSHLRAHVQTISPKID
jgi:hypothetical protein